MVGTGAGAARNRIAVAMTAQAQALVVPRLLSRRALARLPAGSQRDRERATAVDRADGQTVAAGIATRPTQ